MSGRGKFALIGSVLLLIAVMGADYFLPESSAIFWHLRHGVHADMQGIRFRVPLMYEENHGDSLLELSFDTSPGHLNRKLAFVTVDFHKIPSPQPDSPKRRSC